jgi:hypothetical protein
VDKTLTSSPRQKIENKNEMTNFSLSCINCGCREEIHLIAHRDKDKYICGFIVVCAECSEALKKDKRYIRLVVDK